MSSMEAPVVPMREARSEPAARKAVFTAGRASRSPSSITPPEITNRLPSRTMKDR